MGGDGLEPPEPIAAGRQRCAGCGQDLPVPMMMQRSEGWWCRSCYERTLPPPPVRVRRPPDWRARLADVDWRRVSIALVRAGGYAAALAICSRFQLPGGSVVYGCLAGAYSADNLTWLGFRLLDLPGSVTTMSVESAIAVASGLLLIAWQGAVVVPQEPTAFACSFLAFLLVLALKVAWRFARASEGEP